MGIADDIKTLGFNTTLVKVLFICNCFDINRAICFNTTLVKVLCNLGGYEILQNRFQYNSC